MYSMHVEIVYVVRMYKLDRLYTMYNYSAHIDIERGVYGVSTDGKLSYIIVSNMSTCTSIHVIS